MVQYDPKNWFAVVTAVRGTIIKAVLARLWWIVGIAAVIWWLDTYVPEADWMFRPFKPTGHSLLGLAIGLLIVFHNNCAYDRFWEGRKLWGSIVNSARNLVRGGSVYVGDARELANLTSAYVVALKQHLRDEKELSKLKPFVSDELIRQLESAGNPPSLVALEMSRWIHGQVRSGVIDTVTAQSLESQVRALVEAQGGCERIRGTPMPFLYAVLIKQMLVAYLLTLPFALVTEMGWAVIPTTAVIGFGMIGIEEAGVEIEDPFGTDDNDLPLESLCATIIRDVEQLGSHPSQI